jgi:hypothetical protein
MNKGKVLMSLSLMVISAGVIITALKWPLKAALFPVAIGISVFFMTIAEFWLSLSGKGKVEEDVSGVDFKLTESGDLKLANRRTISISLWIFGFFFLILLVGFHIAVPLFFILFWKLYGKEGWVISIGLAAIAWFSFYGLFIWLLNIPFMEGWGFKGLKAIGVIG